MPVLSVTTSVCGYPEKHVRFHVELGDTIASFMEKIEAEYDVPVRLQLLSSRHVQLHAKIRDHGVLREAVWSDYELPERISVLVTDYGFFDLFKRSTDEWVGDIAETLQITDTAKRGITLKQLRALESFAKLCCAKTPSKNWSWYDTSEYSSTYRTAVGIDSLNLYHVVEWVVKPATLFAGCSFVELLATNAASQVPHWFVSHWWGEPILLFIRCIHEHFHTRQLDDTDAVYWVCAYANNQHDLADEIPRNPRDTSFFNAMIACRGIVMVLDAEGVVFGRVWCCFETATALTTRTLLLDIVTATAWTSSTKKGCRAYTEDHDACVITEGLTLHERRECGPNTAAGEMMKARREANFPISLIVKAMGTRIELSHASVELDRKRILNSICNLPQQDLDLDPPLEHDAYTEVNSRLRAIFAVAGWLNCLKNQPHLTSSLCEAVRSDEERRVLKLSMADCDGLNDERMAEVARSFPPKLRELELNVPLSRFVTSAGVRSLGFALQTALPELRTLRISLGFCRQVDDDGIRYLFDSLPKTLKSLQLDVRACRLTDDIVHAMAPILPEGNLRSFKLFIGQCKEISDFCFCNLVRLLPPTLQTLELDFEGCPYISDVGAEKLHAFLTDDSSSIRRLKTHLHHTGVSEPWRKILASWQRNLFSTKAVLERLSHGQSVFLDFLRRCDDTGDGHIPANDMVAALSNVCPDLPREQILSLFEDADTDGDGVIDYEEFCDWLFA